MNTETERLTMSEFGTFDTQMLGISEDDIKEVDASEAEVLSRVLTSRIKDIVVTIRPDGFTFNTTCIRSMVDVVYILMYIDRKKHMLYVGPAEEFDKDSHRWCNEKDGKRTSRKITGRPAGGRFYELMGWSKAYSYRVTGYPARQEGVENEYLLAFNLNEYDQRLLTEKGLEAAGVEDKDLGADAAQIHAEIAKEQAQKEKAREEAKATGKKKRSRSKTTYFGVVEDGAFGILKKDYVPRIEIPPYEQMELLSVDNVENENPPSEEGGGP